MTPPLVRRWEGLSAWTQALVAFPVAFVAMLLLHLGPFNQPALRAVGYAVFWGAIATAAIVVASRAERAKRSERERRGRQ